ncbi:Type-2Aa cytolytic delta-endotoxin [Streptomyces sp. NPDC002004]
MADQPAAGKTTFRPVLRVGATHLEQAENVVGAFQHAIAPATVDYDFGEISRAAGAVPGASTVRIVRGWGLRETAPVNVMVLSLKEAVRQALPQPFADAGFWEEAGRALTDAFVGLGSQEGTHLSFHDGTPHSTSYYYNVLFVLQGEETGDSLYALALCADVTVALEKEKVLALGLGDTASYAIRVNAITVRQALASAA